MKTELLRIESLNKSHNKKAVITNVTFTVFAGETVALLGASGAGKTTVSDIIGGISQYDSGRIFYFEQHIRPHSLSDAQEMGIHVLKHPGRLLDTLTVAENIMLSRQKKGFINSGSINRAAARMLKTVGLDTPPDTPTGRLGDLDKSMVELAAILHAQPRLLLLDEPLFSYTEANTRHLHHIMASLKKKGASVIYLTHNIKDALEFADRIVVMRDGMAVGIYKKESGLDATLLKTMAGYAASENVPQDGRVGDTIMEVQGYSGAHFHDISFHVDRGEIVGIAGQYGSQKSRLLSCLYGVYPKTGGRTIIKGKAVDVKSPKVAMKHGLSCFSSIKKDSGLVYTMNTRENISLQVLKKVSYGGFINSKLEEHLAKTYMRLANIPEDLLDVPLCNLSNGLQQRIQLMQCYASDPDIFLLYEPTMGMDIASKKEMRAMIGRLAQEGYSLVVASSEMEEVIEMCDRILIMNHGRLVGELSKQEASQGRIIELIQQ